MHVCVVYIHITICIYDFNIYVLRCDNVSVAMFFEALEDVIHEMGLEG